MKGEGMKGIMILLAMALVLAWLLPAVARAEDSPLRGAILVGVYDNPKQIGDGAPTELDSPKGAFTSPVVGRHIQAIPMWGRIEQ